MTKGSFIGNIAQDLGLDIARLDSGRARIFAGDNSEYVELIREKGILVVKERMDREALCGQTSPFVLESAVDLDVGVNTLQSYTLKPTDNFVLKVKPQPDGSKHVEMVLETQLDREKAGEMSLLLTAVDDVGGTGTLQHVYNYDVCRTTDSRKSDMKYLRPCSQSIINLDACGTQTVQPEDKKGVDDQSDDQTQGAAVDRTVTLPFQVSDVNDNAPIFEKSSYEAHITENNSPGLSIFSIKARDADWSHNARVSYILAEGTVNGVPVSSYVSVNSDSGVIHAVRSFDYEQIKDFQFHIKAQDGGSPPLTSSVMVKVFIQDQNDNAPQILYPIQGGVSLVAEMVPRSAEVGFLVTKVVAVDVDSGQNAWLSFKLLKATDRALFEVGLQNGEIRTLRQVTEKDAVKQRLAVVVEDNGKPSRSATVNVNVVVADSFPELFPIIHRFTQTSEALGLCSTTLSLTILLSDVNDNPPIFEKSSNNVTVKVIIQDQNDNAPQILYPVQTAVSLVAEMVPRSAGIGYLVTKVVAVDVDSRQNAWLSYRLLKATDRALFEVGLQNGEIRTLRQVTDKDAVKQRLTAVVEDNGQPSRSATVIVNVVVADSFPEVLSEFTDFTHDKDYNDNLTIISLDNCGTQTLPHKVEKTALDRETDSEFNVSVTCCDEGELPLSSSITLTVQLSDVNDNAPIFEKKSYETYINENNSPGMSVFSVKARDADWGQNSRVSYLLEEGTVNGMPLTSYISVDSESGVIHALRSFDYEQIKEFQFRLKAQDGGSPPLSSNVTVTVIIQDQNDNAPQIIYPVQTGVSLVAEIVPRSAEIGYLVTKVVAVDVDSGQNAWLSYKLLKATDRALFELGLQNGEIRTLRQVTDKDVVKQRLTVVVEDNGQPSRSATVIVNVVVADSFPDVLSDIISLDASGTQTLHQAMEKEANEDSENQVSLFDW
ncbi:hypothetical protein JZ751_006880 [Albula glossodonta]|uniref:Cadherin domain-containing protein n=1 Tax=Albula glossodonta TaxID=121402 RepID=A0A8T2P2M8_9TELE|nr:hypothetical protein JZ751_006880 [Albula glossodonta]